MLEDFDQISVELNVRFSERPMSPIMAILEMATMRQAAGEDIVAFVTGEPDFDTPVHVKEAAIAAIHAGQTKYTSVHGTLELREAVRQKFIHDQGVDYAIDQICVGAGAKQLLFNALSVTLSEGDEVVVPTPVWGSYGAMVKIAGGIPVKVPARAEDGFLVQPEDLERAITDRTRWLMINSPNNPTGAVYGRQDLEGLAEVLRRHPKVMVLSDEMYEKIIFDDKKFVSFVEAAPDLVGRILLVNGVSKAYAMTGWRVGYGAGPADLVSAMAALQSQSTTNPCSISQAATIAALTGPQDILAEQCAEYQSRRNMVVDRIRAMPGLSCQAPAGAFYLFASMAGLVGKSAGEHTINTDLDFVRYMLDVAKVAIVPGAPFGAEHHFRMSFAASQSELSKGLDRMAAAIANLN
ncbi:pyridoxal phosphate-dependent aminotransferase [Lentibacter algarum]|uniref:pyridoxal phosphate-dependent aminotransferase n=1 Tax=Lentibacter algarum TaxID=576131 RepID=UPI001C08FBD8|nr:pyridoxal phosphate-dependent aminotransferase [Lentibacter algarum]MBU2983683.1 pyridoxal phosphate-dependent aminotransferase [Lentibacter algarum]